MGTRSWKSFRAMLAAVAAFALVSAVPSSAFAADAMDVSGTVHSKNEEKETIILITDDLGRKNQPITIDMSRMSDNFVAIREGQSVTLTIIPRENDSYRAWYLVDQDSYTQRLNLGTEERFETQSSSIKAHVGNVPEDDEALGQQHRENNLQRKQDQDSNNQPGGQGDSFSK